MQLIEERKRLHTIKEEVGQRLLNVPEGTLRLSKSQGCVQYYHCTKGSPHNGIYIHKNDIELAKQLAQKSYDEKIYDYTEKTIKYFDRLLSCYTDEKIAEIYANEHIERQKLITPLEPTYDQLIEKWISTPFKGKGFAEGAPVIMTNSGIRVRSKSEKIMADYFDSLGIVYKYECPCHLNNYGTVYPDFTFLSRKTHKEVYWEHEGMMDNPEYARTAILKIETYAKNGIICGENLILSFESSISSINTELLKIMTDKYLL